MRPGVTFHDGSPLTASDVVYSYRRIIDGKLANADKLSAVTDVTATDDHTVRIVVATLLAAVPPARPGRATMA